MPITQKFRYASRIYFLFLLTALFMAIVFYIPIIKTSLGTESIFQAMFNPDAVISFQVAISIITEMDFLGTSFYILMLIAIFLVLCNFIIALLTFILKKPLIFKIDFVTKSITNTYLCVFIILFVLLIVYMVAIHNFNTSVTNDFGNSAILPLIFVGFIFPIINTLIMQSIDANLRFPDVR